MAREWTMPRQPAASGDQHLISQENMLLRELVTVYQRLTGLALQSADVGTVVQLLAQRTSAIVAVVSQALEVVTAAGPGGPSDEVATFVAEHLASARLATVLRSTAQTRRSMRLPQVGEGGGVTVAPILVGDEVPAYLVTLGDADHDSGGDLSLLVTEHAATICGVMLSRERVVAAAARQVRDDLVEGLLLGGRDDEVTRWARHLGYDPAVAHRVLAVTVDPAAGERMAVAIEQFCATRAGDAITSIRADEVIVVVTDPAAERAVGAELSRLATGCLDRMRDMFPEKVISIGIGGICRGPGEIAQSYGQARRTIDAMARLGRRGQVVAFDDLGIHRLLLQIPDLTELAGFATEVLGKLIAVDRQRGTEFVATLACYFRENNSPQRTARALHVHPNTVAYRIRRIGEITGLQLDAYRDRMLAQVALEVIDVLGADRAGSPRSAGSSS